MLTDLPLICYDAATAMVIEKPSFNTAKISETSFRRQVPSTKIQNPAEENTTLAIPCNLGDFDELEERVKSMMEKSQNKIAKGQGYIFAYLCKVCGKEGQHKNIKDHIEANHLEGIVIPCNLCDKTFRSRQTLRNHKSRHVTSNARMI